MRRKIGVFKVFEAKEFTNHYETAAWYMNVLVQPGDYDAFLLTDRYPWVVVSLPGIVTKSFFPTLWGGVMVGNRGIDEKVGQEATHSMQFNPYMIAKFILDKSPNWELEPDVKAVAITKESYVNPGRMIDLTKLVVDGKEY